MPLLRRGLAAHVCRLGDVSALRDLSLAADLNRGEIYYPLHVYVCEQCFLVQLEEYESAENIFSDYAYFSSYSDSWLKHSENYCDKMTKRFGLNEQSFVVEVASNDGYLLQYFVAAASAGAGYRASGECGQSGGRKGRSHAGAVLRRATGETSWRPKAAAPIWFSATTCWRRFRT